MALFRRARRENLATRVEREGGRLSQMAAERGSETSRRVSDILRRAAEDIRSAGVGEYRARAMDAMDTARARVDEMAEKEREMIRTRPLTSVAVAMGVGMLAGMAMALISSRMISRYEY